MTFYEVTVNNCTIYLSQEAAAAVYVIGRTVGRAGPEMVVSDKKTNVKGEFLRLTYSRLGANPPLEIRYKAYLYACRL